jgi:SAM-dependent methyltransferase
VTNPPPAVPNADMISAWDGEEGDRWVAQADHYEASARPHGLHLLKAAGIRTTHRVLDVGCGFGETTREAARRASSGMALGVDLSSKMLELARELARKQGLPNVQFQQADAQVYAFAPRDFDVAISRFGAMFFDDPTAAFRNIGRALRPGGRLAVLAWQDLSRNEWISSLRGALAAGRMLPEPPNGAPGPFGLAEPRIVERILDDAGFRTVEFAEISEPITLGANADDAYEFVRSMGITKGLLQELDADRAARALAAVRASLAEHEAPSGVAYGSGAWLITATVP